MMDTDNTAQKNNTHLAKVIYFLFIVSTIVGITGIIGLIMAYVFKDDAEDWLQTHYRFQIRTFWIGLLYLLIGSMTITVIFGYLVLLFTFFWLIIRCAKGLKQLEKNQPVKNLESWLLT